MSTPPWGEQPEPDPNQTQPAPPQSPGPEQQPYGAPGQQPYGQPGQQGYEQQPYGQQQPHGQQSYGQYGQPYGQSPYGSYAYTPPAPTNGMAIASLVVSIAGLLVCCGAPSIVGAILGHVARKQIRERGESGAGLALAGIIVGWIAFGLFVLVAAFYGLALGFSLSESS